MSSIDQILTSLAAVVGYAELRTACLKFASRKGGDMIATSGAGSGLASKKPSDVIAPSGAAKLFSSASSVVSETESVGSSVSSTEGKKKKEKKESKPRGKSSWNIQVDETLKEMRDAFMETFVGENPEATEEEIVKASEKAVTYKMAFARASEKKREGNPEAQAKYEESKAKRAAKKAEKASEKSEKSSGAEKAAKIPLPASSNSSAVEDAE